jgi:hypothetical protein
MNYWWIGKWRLTWLPLWQQATCWLHCWEMGMTLNTIELSLLRDNHLRFIASLTVDWDAVIPTLTGTRLKVCWLILLQHISVKPLPHDCLRLVRLRRRRWLAWLRWRSLLGRLRLRRLLGRLRLGRLLGRLRLGRLLGRLRLGRLLGRLRRRRLAALPLLTLWLRIEWSKSLVQES